MARLERLPDSATIMAMRGRVDFYEWKGVPVARAWPQPSRQPRTAGSIASSRRFQAYTKMTGAIDPGMRADYRRFVRGHGITWVDAFRAFAGGRGWIVLP